jgi:hypothetical protein
VERVFAFYTLASATALADALALVDEGRLVVNVVDMPIKCPVAARVLFSGGLVLPPALCGVDHGRKSSAPDDLRL